MTVREMVREYQREIRDTEMPPGRAADVLTKLTALLGNISDEIRQADAAYADVLLRELETSEKANRARIKAETTPEYQRKREARDLQELTKEMIGSLKYYLRSQEAEMRLSR